MQKNNANLELLVDEYIHKLNAQSKEAGLERFYSYSIVKGTAPLDNSRGQIKKGGKRTYACYRTFKFTVADLITRERTVLFTTDFVGDNPSAFLKPNYRKSLFREFLYNCFGVFAINMETQIRANESISAVNDIKFNAKEEEEE